MLKLGLLLLCAPSVLLMGAYMFEQNDIEACIASGGSWEYVQGLCDTHNSHDFVPFMVRYPVLVNGGMLLSILGCLLTIAALYLPSKRQSS